MTTELHSLTEDPVARPCRSVDRYTRLNVIQEGTYGIVYRGQDKETGDIVALKMLKLEKEREGFPVTSLREINALMHAAPDHPNLVRLREVVVGRRPTDVFIVMDFIEHDLRTLMEQMRTPFHLSEVKTLLRQLLSATAAMHKRWIVHRDLKTSNLLLSNRGEIKVADFGLARKLTTPRTEDLTPMVVTLWYRAPELLLGATQYTWAVDMWSIGCIMGELITGKALFPGDGEISQIGAILKTLGTPTRQSWPTFSDLPHASKMTLPNAPQNLLHLKYPALTNAGLDLMKQLLQYDPSRRITAEAALKHPFFTEYPLPKDPLAFPSWPSRSLRSPPRQ